MILLDNIIFALQRSGGVSVYWKELIENYLIQNNLFNKEIFFMEDKKVSENNFFRKSLNLPENLIFNYKVSLINRIFPVNLNFGSNFIFHSSYYRISKSKNAFNITTVHDFIQEKLYPSFYNLNIRMKKNAILNSDGIIVISNSIKYDLLNLYPELDEKCIKVIYNGVSKKFGYIENLYYEKKDNNFILFVGSRVNYKNFDFTIRVLEKLKDYDLYIVGESLKSEEEIKLKNKIGNRFKAFPNASLELLNELYNQATALIYPSSYEGFGIPAIEAMKCGCPVIARDIPSIKEISNGACLLIDKLNLDDYISAILEVKNNRHKYQFLGMEVASKFSWKNTAEETFSFYEQILK